MRFGVKDEAQTKAKPAVAFENINRYLLEKTWGILKWRINNADAKEGQISADFEFTSYKDTLGQSYSAVRHSPLISTTLQDGKEILHRYVLVEIQIAEQLSVTTICEFAWDFRYSEGEDCVPPPDLLAVCGELVRFVENM